MSEVADEEKDYYQILGLDVDATEQEIKNAYRKLGNILDAQHFCSQDVSSRY